MSAVRGNVSNHHMDTIRIAMNMNKWVVAEWSVSTNVARLLHHCSLYVKKISQMPVSANLIQHQKSGVF